MMSEFTRVPTVRFETEGSGETVPTPTFLQLPLFHQVKLSFIVLKKLHSFLFVVCGNRGKPWPTIQSRCALRETLCAEAGPLLCRFVATLRDCTTHPCTVRVLYLAPPGNQSCASIGSSKVLRTSHPARMPPCQRQSAC